MQSVRHSLRRQTMCQKELLQNFIVAPAGRNKLLRHICFFACASGVPQGASGDLRGANGFYFGPLGPRKAQNKIRLVKEPR